MKVLPFLFILCSLSAASIISPREIEGLLVKFMLNTLTEDETQSLQQTLELLHRPKPLSEDSLENSSKLRRKINCLLCRKLFHVLFLGIKLGLPEKKLEDTSTFLCSFLGITQNVCSGAISLNMPIIAHIIRTTPKASPDAFCGLIFQTDEDPDSCSFSDPRFEWQVDLPEKSRIAPARTFNHTPLKVAVITDVHINPTYEPFGVADCNEPTCCRKGQSPAKSLRYVPNDNDSLLEKNVIYDNGELKFNLSIASKTQSQKKQFHTKSSIQPSGPAGYWGDYRNCDTPIWAFDDAIESIHENHMDVEMIYYIGDTIDHGVWDTSFKLVKDMNQYLVEKIRKTFGNSVLFVPAFGNHDTQPINQYAPASVVGPLNTTWLYESLVNKWCYFLPEEAKMVFRQSGDFSLQARPGLRVISLNNNVAYKYNWWVVYDPLDAKRHLDWLVQELHKAELAGEKVHILTHIPPGVADLTYTWTREYNRIVNRFTETIAAEFNGHTHTDEFQIFYSPDYVPINVAWRGGSLTTNNFYNLNYKIFTFDTQTFVPKRISSYIYNLTEANLTPYQRPHWFLLYEMQDTFRLSDLSAQSMHDLVFSMVTDNRDLLAKYSAFYSKLSDPRWQYCYDECKMKNICKTVITVLWERQICDKLTSLYFS